METAFAPLAMAVYGYLMAIGATVSDLHLFSHHARPHLYLERIQATAREASVFILNGDIFDFKWSEHGVFTASVTAAEYFLEQLLEAAPDCQFRIILGNHDAVPPYVEALDALAGRYQNLEWHEFTCCVENRIFLHGDVIHAGSSNKAVRRFRSRLQQPSKAYAWQRMAHLAAHRSHVSWMAFKVLPKRILASRILAYLENENCMNGGSIRHIYFGHTHADFENFRYAGYHFHNCGSATHGARLRVAKFPLMEDQR